eukprot:11792976-Alexandrium_andersonii.AAC.1
MSELRKCKTRKSGHRGRHGKSGYGGDPWHSSLAGHQTTLSPSHGQGHLARWAGWGRRLLWL